MDEPSPGSPEVIHLTLRGRRSQALVRDAADWVALSEVAERMLFWCGGFLHGCRCEGSEMHFALELASAPIGSVVRHLAGAYAGHLRKRYRWSGGVFKHYIAGALEAELFLADLVIWLHRRPTSESWTADDAYRHPNSMPWITTERVCAMLGGAGTPNYRRRQAEATSPQVLSTLLRGYPLKERSATAFTANPSLRSDERALRCLRAISLVVATQTGVSYEEMMSRSRRRAVSSARALVAVRVTRHGGSVAEVARLFGRTRSTLIEQAEHYRRLRPDLFESSVPAPAIPFTWPGLPEAVAQPPSEDAAAAVRRSLL